MLTAPRPDHLATADERVASERLAVLEAQLADADTPELVALQQRAARLRGAIVWQLETHYHERLTETYEHLQALNTDVEAMQARYEAFVRARQAAMHSYVGYEMPINHLRMRVRGALERLSVLMARQGHMLETVAINELKIRRDRLEAYQNQARYAFADSYDRAAKAQGTEPVADASDPVAEEQG